MQRHISFVRQNAKLEVKTDIDAAIGRIDRSGGFRGIATSVIWEVPLPSRVLPSHFITRRVPALVRQLHRLTRPPRAVSQAPGQLKDGAEEHAVMPTANRANHATIQR
jgi:hypothetical protein